MTGASENQSKEHQEHVVKGSEVFVGGLPRTLAETNITELFADCGEILEMRLIKDVSGKSKGYCFIRFTTKEAASKAIKEKSGMMLEGKKIGVLPSMDQTSLFLGNLRKDWSADQFNKMVCQAFQDVVSVDLAMPPKSADNVPAEKHRNRGFGFVRFSSHAAAARAYRMGSKADFVLGGNLHPTVEWAQEEPEVDPEELAKVKIGFVRHLPTDVDEDFLRNLFGQFGKLERVVLSRKGRSTCGFVHFESRADLDTAIKEMNRKVVKGSNGGAAFEIQVEVAKPMDKARKRAHDVSQSKPAIITLSRPNQAVGHSSSSSIDGQKSKIPKLKHAMEDAHMSDPYEAAAVTLPVAVKERLLRILRLGIATRFDIDIQCIARLNELPESTAIYVLDQFMVTSVDVSNRGAYLARLISQMEKLGLRRNALHVPRVREVAYRESKLLNYSDRVPFPAWQTEKLSSPKTLHAPRVAEFTSRDPTLPNFPDRVHLPAVDNLDSHLVTERTRHDYYASIPFSSCYSVSALDLKLPHETAYERMVTEMSPIHSHHLALDSFPRQTGFREPEVLHSSHLHRTATPPTYVRHGLESPLSSTVDLQSRHQVRFDPFTGEPYKFDPFTGEPIRLDSVPRSGSWN